MVLSLPHVPTLSHPFFPSGVGIELQPHWPWAVCRGLCVANRRKHSDTCTHTLAHTCPDWYSQGPETFQEKGSQSMEADAVYSGRAFSSLLVPKGMSTQNRTGLARSKKTAGLLFYHSLSYIGHTLDFVIFCILCV